MKKANIEIFYQALSDQDPEPKGELDWVNIYTLLVAVVFSAQATDIGVNKATGPLFKKVKTPKAMLKLGETGRRTTSAPLACLTPRLRTSSNCLTC